MALQEGGMARPYAQPFPHPVAEDEARVEHRHHRALARHEFAVDPDEDALVSRIILELVRAVGHPAWNRPLLPSRPHGLAALARGRELLRVAPPPAGEFQKSPAERPAELRAQVLVCRVQLVDPRP